MCGIAGYVQFASGEPSREVLSAMAYALRRRGPDASGILVDGACGLAHTRLSVIDVEGSPQPMRVAESDLSVVYNGELYNYALLREELRSIGRHFDTNGDTEVLLRWVEQEWDKGLPRFDGMYGFAAWDRRREMLLLARDPLGVKPLFYATPSPGVLVFGSEVKALLAHPAVDGELDQDALRQVLRFRAVYGDGSLYRGVRQLAPGTFLEFSSRGTRVGNHYDLVERVGTARERQRNKSEREIGDEGEKLLEDAVRKRLIADVPVGAFLSGGLDSSVIVALMRRLRAPGEQVCTFSVGFSDDRHSELPFAQSVADHFATTHHETRIGPALYESRLMELTGCRDAPLSEPADIAIAQMSLEARRSVKVVLSGEGADEVFAGYPKYRFSQSRGPISMGLRVLGADNAASLAGFFGLDRRRALVAARAMSLPNELDRLAQWFSYLDPGELGSLLPGLDWEGPNWTRTTQLQQSILDRIHGASPLCRMQMLDCLTWLPSNLLERGDRMTMAEGLEMRVPFLDRAMVPYGLALNDSMKVRGGVGKRVLRRWANKLIPHGVIARQKWGFRVPLAEWFRGKLKPLLNDYLRSRHGLCGTFGARAKIDGLLEAHDRGRIDANLSLWTLLVAEVWYQNVYLGMKRSRVDVEIPVPEVAMTASLT